MPVEEVEAVVVVEVEEEETSNVLMVLAQPALTAQAQCSTVTSPLLPVLTEASPGPVLTGALRSEWEGEDGVGRGTRSVVTAPLRPLTETRAPRPALTAADQSVVRTSVRRLTYNLWRPSNILYRHLTFIYNSENLKDLLNRDWCLSGPGASVEEL